MHSPLKAGNIDSGVGNYAGCQCQCIKGGSVLQTIPNGKRIIVVKWVRAGSWKGFDNLLYIFKSNTNCGLYKIHLNIPGNSFKRFVTWSKKKVLFINCLTIKKSEKKKKKKKEIKNTQV